MWRGVSSAQLLKIVESSFEAAAKVPEDTGLRLTEKLSEAIANWIHHRHATDSGFGEQRNKNCS